MAPPKLPAPSSCWPNQAVLDENCARISILLENKSLPKGTSVEGMCFSLRTIVGLKLVNAWKDAKPPMLILLCDNKSGSNDTIEVTVVSATALLENTAEFLFYLYFNRISQSSQPNNPDLISDTVAILGEMLSRGSSLGPTYTLDQAEAAPLAAVLEVKVCISNSSSFFFH